MNFLRKLAKRYFIDAMGAMAQGLFASLLIGTIFNALGMIPYEPFGIFSSIGAFAQQMAGPAMAVAIAYSLKSDPLVIFSSLAVGFAANKLGAAGGPFAVFIIAIIACEVGRLVSKKTKVDILVTPLITIFVGCGLSLLIAPFINTLVGYVSTFIGWASEQVPFIASIIISVVVGVILTLPISSAAICAGLGLSGIAAAAGNSREGLAIAGAAAVAGCCAQMVGFAVISFRENRWGGIVSQGLGTSMLQMPNIVRHPQIWIAPTLASAITGPIAVCLFNLRMYGAAINSGMGTCGLLGPIGMILGWYDECYPKAVTALDWVGLALVCFVLPAVLSFAVNELLRKLGAVKTGYMKLEG